MAEQVNWQGASGRLYAYWVYPINAAFKDEPGNYIYAKRGSAGTWQAVYVGQTSSLSQRLASHEKEQSAIQYGKATHILAHLSPNPIARMDEEQDLIRRLVPPLNKRI
jgi:excinuclease UvrABC nuclease subunit